MLPKFKDALDKKKFRWLHPTLKKKRCQMIGELTAWPNWTSDLKRRAQVPLTQATTGLLTFPSLSASTNEYSSRPPNSPKTTISLICYPIHKKCVNFQEREAWYQIKTSCLTFMQSFVKAFLLCGASLDGNDFKTGA